MLITTKTLPPGGWAYQDPTTGFKPDPFQPFNDAVAAIVDNRKANNLPRATFLEAAFDLDTETCMRLGNDPLYCDDGKKKLYSPPAWQAAARAAAHAGGKLRKVAAGAQILVDWVGDGLTPVSKSLAQDRADVCTGRLNSKPCPHNTHQGIANLTGPIADFIKKQLQKKSELRLSVEGEEKLETCGICICQNNLKIWTPLDVILDRTSEQVLADFRQKADWCWILKEKQTQTPA